MRRRYLVWAVLVLQVLCAFFFVSGILTTVLGIPLAPINWAAREVIELGAAMGLLFGILMGFLLLRATQRRSDRIESQLRVASGAFMDLLEDSFDTWKLTPAEREVALFAIKGYSTLEIAGLRKTSEGTVKAQTNAIYRKAGVTGRPQLLSLFIEDLMDGKLEGGTSSDVERRDQPVRSA